MQCVRKNIEAERGRLGMTKGDMCQALGITLKTYNGYLLGASIPSSVLEKLNRLTGRSIDYLLGLPAPTDDTDDRKGA